MKKNRLILLMSFCMSGWLLVGEGGDGALIPSVPSYGDCSTRNLGSPTDKGINVFSDCGTRNPDGASDSECGTRNPDEDKKMLGIPRTTSQDLTGFPDDNMSEDSDMEVSPGGSFMSSGASTPENHECYKGVNPQALTEALLLAHGRQQRK